MSALLGWLLATVLEEARILAVRTETVGTRQALRIVTAGRLTDVAVTREGLEVVVTLGATAAAELAPGPVAAPIEAIRIETLPTETVLRVRVAAEIPYEVRRDGELLTILFGGRPAEPQTVSPDLAGLYRKVFPPPIGQPQEPAGGEGLEEREGALEEEERREGLRLGSLTLRPSAALTYVDAKTALLETAQPVADRYYQIQPRLGGQMPVGTGELVADYEVRLRGGSSVRIVETTSHLGNAALELPVGPRLLLRVSGHYARGTLETNEVDPGREYFFRLGRFTRGLASAGARIEVTDRLNVDLAATVDKVRVTPGAGFFGHETRGASAGLGLDLSPGLRGSLGFVYQHVPPPATRPEAESRTHSGHLTLDGELLPLVSGQLTVGYTDRRSPRAAEGGTRFRGFVLSANVTKSFTRTSWLRLQASRSTQLSAFEGNAFYVSSTAQAELNLGLPFSFSLRGGAGYHWNDYRTAAAGIGEPRKDRITGWSVGLGRPVSRRAYLRADYRKERRDSNVQALDTNGRALTVEVGLGLFPTAARR